VLQKIHDEYIVTAQVNRPQNFREELTGLAHEWAPRFVFRRAWGLSNANEVGVWIPLARYGIARRLVQVAPAAAGDHSGDVFDGFRRAESFGKSDFIAPAIYRFYSYGLRRVRHWRKGAAPFSPSWRGARRLESGSPVSAVSRSSFCLSLTPLPGNECISRLLGGQRRQYQLAIAQLTLLSDPRL
jgi:hypothetical protein